MSRRGAGDDRQRLVITGMGVITPIGESLEAYWGSLAAGRSAITRWKRSDERIGSTIGGDMSDFSVEAHLVQAGAAIPAAFADRARRLLRATPLSGRLTASAALEAFIDAGLHAAPIEPESIGHVLAGHNVTSNYVVENVKSLLEEPDFLDPLFGLMALDTDVLSVGSELLSVKGPSQTVGGACASGNLGLLAAMDLLRLGRASVVIVSGGSADLDPATLQAWTLLDALASRSFNDEPARASRPFDRRREGFVPCEGAGAVVVETLAGARARGARIRAELYGGANSFGFGGINSCVVVGRAP